MAVRKDNPCEACLHCEVCGSKDKLLSTIAQANNGTILDVNGNYIGLEDIPWINITVSCMHFKHK